jgi:superfamily II DNA/RNA helicase
VLDEADRMVQRGHYEELTSILARVPKPGGGGPATVTDADFDEALRAAQVRARPGCCGGGE